NYFWAAEVLGVLLNIVGSTLIVTWVATLVSQIVLRRRAEAAGSALPLRMWGYPWLSYATLAGIAVIIGLGLTVESVRFQIVGTLFFAVGPAVVGSACAGPGRAAAVWAGRLLSPRRAQFAASRRSAAAWPEATRRSAAAWPEALTVRFGPGRARRSAREGPSTSPIPPTRRACPGSVLCGGRSDDRRSS